MLKFSFVFGDDLKGDCLEPTTTPGVAPYAGGLRRSRNPAFRPGGLSAA
jgi:hypothetical protein